MSRNHTEYYVLKRDDENFLDSVRTCKTFDRARRVLAVTGADEIAKWRVTPSGVALTTAYPVKQRRDSLKKLYRKHNRRVADAKRRMERRYENIFASSLRCHYTRNMGVRQFCRYLSGVRKGTIL